MKIKDILKNRKFIITVASVVTIVGISIGSTFAYYTSVTEDIVNSFNVGSIDTELNETISGLNKEPRVKNTGKTDCLVRMRVTISPSDTGITLDLPGAGWKQIGEFYYYEGVLAPNAETLPLFTKVTLPGDWYSNGSILESEFIPFDIGIYQEAVQATVYDNNGNDLSAFTVDAAGNKVYNAENAAAIWASYDAGK